MEGEHSEEIAALATALAKAQGAIKAALKDTNNPHLKTRYADLASVWNACREFLSENELAIIQTPSFDGELVTLVTTLVHSSGQWWRSILSAPPPTGQGNAMQQMGAGISYLRRFALSSMVGIAPEDDDNDGDSGQRNAAAMSAGQRMDDATPRTDFDPRQLDIVLARIKAIPPMATEDQLDTWGTEFRDMKWRKAAERKVAADAFAEKRKEVMANRAANPEPPVSE